ncbi:hypothetical protein SAMN05443252_103240 [Bacillus sp. OV322]|nr:hypothetical protein SAMN05443252_103240 [Bacillus sp. OV322]
MKRFVLRGMLRNKACEIIGLIKTHQEKPMIFLGVTGV